MAASANVKHVPVRDLVVKKDGHIRPLTYYGGKGLDVRTVSGEFLLSLQKLWREQGDEILRRVAAQYPELIFISQVKLAKVMRVEIGSPDEFSKLGSKQAIIEKLEEKAGPEARKLFEKFVRDWEKLQAQQDQEIR